MIPDDVLIAAIRANARFRTVKRRLSVIEVARRHARWVPSDARTLKWPNFPIRQVVSKSPIGTKILLDKLPKGGATIPANTIIETDFRATKGRAMLRTHWLQGLWQSFRSGSHPRLERGEPVEAVRPDHQRRLSFEALDGRTPDW